MSENEKTKESKTIPFYPDHLNTEIRVVWILVGLAVLIGSLAMFFPVGLEAPADPMVTPPHTKPEWYFLFLYEILKINTVLGVTILPPVWVSIIMIGLVLLILVPFLSKKTDSKRQMIFRAGGSVIFMLFVLFFTFKGWSS